MVSGSRLHHRHRCVRNTASREPASAPGAARQEPRPRPSLLPIRQHRFSTRSGTAPRRAWLLTCLALRQFRVLCQGTRALRSRGPTRKLGPAAEPPGRWPWTRRHRAWAWPPPVEASASRALTAGYAQHLLGLAVLGGATAKETLPFRHLSARLKSRQLLRVKRSWVPRDHVPLGITLSSLDKPELSFWSACK